ncbi:hypothetical protein [Marinibacterium profundimaris]|nr:hypothetical protein [Marinibacterium profundimaris]
MTAEDFSRRLRDAGIPVSETEAKAAWPAAQRLLDLANQLPGRRDD